MQLKDWLSNMQLIIMEDTKMEQLWYYRVIGRLGLPIHYRYKEYLIQSDKSLMIKELERIVSHHMVEECSVPSSVIFIRFIQRFDDGDIEKWKRVVTNKQSYYRVTDGQLELVKIN